MDNQNNIVPLKDSHIQEEINGMSFTKNFRSSSAEEWYVFLPGFKDPINGGAAGKAIIHYNLYGNKEVFINTTVISMIQSCIKRHITTCLWYSG